MIDADDGRIGEKIERQIGAIIRRCPPADVAEQAGGVAQAYFLRRFLDMARRHEGVAPTDQVFAMAGRAGAQQIILARRFHEWIARPQVVAQLLVEQAFAQAAGGNDHLARLSAPDDLLQHHGAIGERRTALRRNRPDGDQRICVDPLDQRGEIGGVARRDDIAMHNFERIIALTHMQLGERAPGSADRVKGAATQTVEWKGAGQLLPGDAQRGLGRAAGGVHQRQRAEFERHALADLRLPLAILDVDQFQRTAAEVADDTIGVVQGRNHAQSRQTGLAHAGNQFDRPANRLLGRREKLRAIRGVPRGGGGYWTHVLYPHEFAEFSKPAQGFERLRHAVFGQSAGGRHALAEAA